MIEGCLRTSRFLKMIPMESTRLGQAPASIAKSIKASLKGLETQVKTLDRLITKHVEQCAHNARKIEVMKSIKGVGPVAISTFIAELPELGELN